MILASCITVQYPLIQTHAMASVVQNVFVPQDPRDEWLILDPQDDTSQKDLPQLVDVVIIGSRIATISPSEKNQTSTDLAQHALQVVLSDVTVKNSEHYLKVLTESFGVDHNHITALSDDATAPRDSRKVPDGLHSRAGAESGAISFDGIQLRLLEVTNCSAGRWLLPGWIDMQVNDLAWMARWEKELFAIDEHVRRILDLLSYQGGDGVTGLCIVSTGTGMHAGHCGTAERFTSFICGFPNGRIKITTRIKAAIRTRPFLSLFIGFLHDMREYNRDILFLYTKSTWTLKTVSKVSSIKQGT